MIRRPPRSTRTDTRFPYTTLFRSALGSGLTVFADNVRLVADGGNVDVAGAIDTSGISGGDIALFGRSGVGLSPGSVLDAHADGYAATDSRQAPGGDVTRGTDDSWEERSVGKEGVSTCRFRGCPYHQQTNTTKMKSVRP